MRGRQVGLWPRRMEPAALAAPSPLVAGPRVDKGNTWPSAARAVPRGPSSPTALVPLPCLLGKLCLLPPLTCNPTRVHYSPPEGQVFSVLSSFLLLQETWGQCFVPTTVRGSGVPAEPLSNFLKVEQSPGGKSFLPDPSRGRGLWGTWPPRRAPAPRQHASLLIATVTDVWVP
uniref:Uncharacterized protein n=1 Tax=Molossus molossus TaxID=27622 RepID=A0A7J8EER6_MOLMO|nr:hypothetical protein HJG59_008835 [Molossus molossus]